MVLRRRAMMKKATNKPAVVVTVTWSGTGSDKTSSIIDTTHGVAHYSLPFDSSSSYITSGSVASDNCMKIRDTALYSDAEATTLVGYYQVNTGTIASTRRTTANSPTYAFETDVVVAPKGYYAKIVACRNGTPFSSNGNFGNYLKTKGNQITLK